MSASVKNLGGGTVSSDGYTLEHICDLDDYTYQGTAFKRWPASVMDSGKYSGYYLYCAGRLIWIVIPQDYGYSSVYYLAGGDKTYPDGRIGYIEQAKTNLGVMDWKNVQPTKLYGLLK